MEAAPGPDGPLDPAERPTSLPGRDPGRLPGLAPAGPGSFPSGNEPFPQLGPGGGATGDLGGSGHGVVVDRRLLLAAGGLVVVLIIALGVVLVLNVGGSDSTSTTNRAGAGPAVGGSPASGGTGAGTQPAGDPADALRSLVNPVVMTGCVTPERSDSAYADASLVCKDSTGVQVSAFHFPSQSAVDRQIGAREAFYSDAGNCDDGQPSSERWSTPQETVGGTRLCYFFAQRFYEFWTYDRDRIAFSASAADPKEINNWWHSFDPIRR